MTSIQGQTVATATGSVRGSEERNALCFRGVPYAVSPIGALRFASPRPHPGWAGVRDARQAGPAVPQGPSRLERVMGHREPDWNEDGCLTLNVFSPAGAPSEQTPRPVLVWFHGGGFTSGSGGWDWYDGSHLAVLGDMVVVTANYRVGPLGYLYLPELGADNLGCQDQRAVLGWVADNIAAFGGDPGRVTVGGQSAGAYSALALALDGQTAPLVSQVLLESGPWGLEPQRPDDAAENADAYLRLLGVPSRRDAREILCELPVERLLSAYSELATQCARPGNVAPPMYPVLGGAGVARSWRDGLDENALAGKALMIGTTRDEATAFFEYDHIKGITAQQAMDVVGAVFGDGARQIYQSHARQLPQATPAHVFLDVLTDVIFRSGVLDIAQHHRAGGNATYVYRFDRRPVDDRANLGATHCVELPFLFGTFDAYPDSPMLGAVADRDHALSHEFASAIAEFVTTSAVGDWPTHSSDSIRLFA